MDENGNLFSPQAYTLRTLFAKHYITKGRPRGLETFNIQPEPQNILGAKSLADGLKLENS